MSAFGFRVVGALTGPRRLIDWPGAFVAHCNADPRTEPERESYLSLFTFGDDFREHLAGTGSTRGYRGPCAMPWHWFDIDREGDLDAALADARGLAAALLHRYRTLDDADLALFFSGSKGFHVGLPGPRSPSSPLTPMVARTFAIGWSEVARVRIDAGIYESVRCFRAPNSRHPRTGLHKRRLALDELMGLTAARIVELAREPLAFDVPTPPLDSALASDWNGASAAAGQARETKGATYTNAPPRLTRTVLRLIQGTHVPEHGDRHRAPFSAAANLAECGCPAALAHELLTEAGANCGLPPHETKRQIDCGLARGK